MIGVFRRVDNAGRVVIPSDYREMLELGEGDYVEIIMNDKGELLIRKTEAKHKM